MQLYSIYIPQYRFMCMLQSATAWTLRIRARCVSTRMQARVAVRVENDTAEQQLSKQHNWLRLGRRTCGYTYITCTTRYITVLYTILHIYTHYVYILYHILYTYYTISYRYCEPLSSHYTEYTHYVHLCILTILYYVITILYHVFIQYCTIYNRYCGHQSSHSCTSHGWV